jgi:hypothetical protein
VRSGAYDEIRDLFAGTLVPGLPTFERRVTGKGGGVALQSRRRGTRLPPRIGGHR